MSFFLFCFIFTLQLDLYCSLVATSTFIFYHLFLFFFLLTLELPEHNVFSLACLSLTWKHSFHFVPTQKYRLYTNEKQRETFNVFCPWI